VDILDLNVRHNATSTWRFSDTPVWSADGAPLTPDAVASRVGGKRVVFLVHGYNVRNVEWAYSAVIRNLQMRMSDTYQVIVRYWWPGSELALAFLLARQRAPNAGRMLRSSIQALFSGSARLRSVDIQAHSLGCMVALEAAMPDNFGPCIRNLVLAAPAVDDKDLTIGKGHDGQYVPASTNVDSIHLFHSKRDIVALPYSWLRSDRMLGAAGPSPTGRLPANVTGHDFTRLIRADHCGYMDEPAYFDAWRALAQ